MPRAYCVECDAEVPVDDDGRCHVGHEVGAVPATPTDTAVGEADHGAADDADPEEPQPWVAHVDLDPDDELPPSERPEARTPEASSAWQPPTAEPVGPGPQPPPEPVHTPDLPLGDDVDVADLEAAVAELGLVDREDEADQHLHPGDGPAGTEPGAAPTTEMPSLSQQQAEAARALADLHGEPAPPAPSEEAGSQSAGAEPAAEEPATPDDEPEGSEGDAPASEDDQDGVDLTNFTARGGKVSGQRKKKRRFFGR